MVEDSLQRIGGHGTAEFAARIGEQMRVGQVQHPNRIRVSFVVAGLNKRCP